MNSQAERLERIPMVGDEKPPAIALVAAAAGAVDVLVMVEEPQIAKPAFDTLPRLPGRRRRRGEIMAAMMARLGGGAE